MLELLGLDYRETPAEVRGRLAFAGDQLAASLRALAAEPTVREAAILSTCNRTEVYYVGDGLQARAAVRAYLNSVAARSSEADADRDEATVNASDRAKRSVVALSNALDLYELSGTEAAEHLLNVAAGLRSMVIGEAQILGQVKDALAAAEAEGTAGDELRLVFSSAVKTGKRARAETEIARADVSLVTLAVRAADEVIGGLAGVNALVIGAGRTSRLCAQHLREAGAASMTFANRTQELAADLARDLQGTSVALDSLDDCLRNVDLVMSATAAPFPVVSTTTIAAARAGAVKPLVIVDLAVPHDVEESAGSLPGVTLIQLDALRQEADDLTLAQGDGTLSQVESIVAEGLRAYQRERTVRMAVPGITALRRHVDRSERIERARVLSELAHVSDADRAIVERFGQRLVDKMFHHLVSRIRSLAEFDEVPPDVTMHVLAQLFADPDAPALPDAHADTSE